MATVAQILAEKGTQVLTIGPEATVLDAALLMNEHKIGSLVVQDAGQVLGIITERDILQRVVGLRRDPGETRVPDVMTTAVIYCQLRTTVEAARSVMKNRRIRHLPVLDEAKRLCGLISIGDLNAYQATSQERTIYVLQEYIYGRV